MSHNTNLSRLLQLPTANSIIASDEDSQNIILHAAQPLILLVIQLRYREPSESIEALQQYLINQVNDFQDQLAQANIPARDITACRYCLCASLDEAILSSSWGMQSTWQAHSLLGLLHQDANGGERFYLILDHLLQNKNANREALELVYVLLSLGFEGRFCGKSLGMREQIRHQLFQYIQQQRGHVSRQLSPHWRDSHQNNHNRYHKFIWLGGSCLSLFGSVWLIANIALHYNSRPLFTALNQINKQPAITIYRELQETIQREKS